MYIGFVEFQMFFIFRRQLEFEEKIVFEYYNGYINWYNYEIEFVVNCRFVNE